MGRIGFGVVGLFYSVKTKEHHVRQSYLEKKYLLHLEFARDVKRYRVQPLKIPYFFEGRWHQYTPDVQVWCSEEILVVEVKPKSQVDDPQNQAKFVAARTYCDERGWRFVVVTEGDIDGVLLENIMQLYSYARYYVPEYVANDVRSILRQELLKKAKVTLGELIDVLASQDLANPGAVAYNLIFFQKIDANVMKEPLTFKSSVSIKGDV